MSKEDLLEEIEILKGYKFMYQNLSEQNKRYREAIENVLEIENYGVATDYIKTVTNILLEALEESE